MMNCVVGTTLFELRCLNDVVGTALLRARFASGMGNAPTDRWGKIENVL